MIRLDNRPLFKFLDISGLPPARIESAVREAIGAGTAGGIAAA